MLDPDLFRPELVDPVTRSTYERIRASASTFGIPGDIAAARAAERAIRASLTPDGTLYESPAASTESIAGPAGSMRLRVFDRDAPTGVYLHLHGGGWVFGAPDLQDRSLERFAERTGFAVVSLDYRLAPEHPYPAPLDDAEAAARWLTEQAPVRFGTERLAIGGSSAGANLALATVLRLRVSGLHSRFRAVVLQSGAYDLTGTPSQRVTRRESMSGADVTRWFFDQYAPGERQRDPEVSPLRADLADLPPTIVVAGSDDRLIDDSMFLYCRLIAASVTCEIVIGRGCDHNFDELPIPEADRANAAVARFVTSHAQA